VNARVGRELLNGGSSHSLRFPTYLFRVFVVPQRNESGMLRLPALPQMSGGVKA
jgi:hypothetical protein